MTKKEWKILETEMEDGKKISKKRFQELIKKTRAVYEHPENYDGPCECVDCMGCM